MPFAQTQVSTPVLNQLHNWIPLQSALPCVTSGCIILKFTVKSGSCVQHPYFWSFPHPANPEDLPSYADSHELDMKKLREPGKHKAAPAAQNVPDHKRARQMAAPSQASAQHQHQVQQPRPTSQMYDQRCECHSYADSFLASYFYLGKEVQSLISWEKIIFPQGLGIQGDWQKA